MSGRVHASFVGYRNGRCKAAFVAKRRGLARASACLRAQYHARTHPHAPTRTHTRANVHRGRCAIESIREETAVCQVFGIKITWQFVVSFLSLLVASVSFLSAILQKLRGGNSESVSPL